MAEQGTIEILESWLDTLGKNLKSIERGTAEEARNLAADTHMEMRKLFTHRNTTNKDGVLQMILRTHAGRGFPSNPTPAKVIEFWQQRYPDHSPLSDGYEEHCRWMGVLIMLGQQAEIAHRLLATGGCATDDEKKKHNHLQPNADVTFSPRIPIGQSMNDRKQEMTNMIALIKDNTTKMRANVSLPEVALDELAIRQQLGQCGDEGVRVGHMIGKGGVRGVLATKLIPPDKPNPDWPLSITIGKHQIAMPSRTMAKLASIHVKGFAADLGDLPVTIPSRALESILADYPMGIIEDRMDWWQLVKKK